MALFIAGVHHNDPLCRTRLICWLDRLSQLNTTRPAFIATEANSTAYQAILEQREIFRQLLKGNSPKLSAEICDTLVRSLYYEADAYQIIFPDTNIIWLDENRELDPNELINYAQNRFNIYKRFLNENNPLNLISKSSWNMDWTALSTDPLGDPDYRRDKIIFNLIKTAYVQHVGSWAIAIIGAGHASNRDHSAKRLLDSASISSNVEILDGRYAN